MPTPQDLGVKMARTLLAELQIIPGAQHLEENRSQLADSVPAEGKFFEYQKDKTKIEPTKEALLQEMFQNQKSTIAFCCASLQTDTRLTFDIDHVFPRELITEKQKLLLNYLNDYKNSEFTKSFMGEDPYDFELQKQINKYFKQDPKDNTIKGTRWFFDVCYNSLNNLFHLKHYLNRGKSATTPKEWFKKNFPPKFVEELNAAGGINEGIIMQQVFSTATLDSVNLGTDTKGNPVVVYLHGGTGIGLGSFIKQWFQSNASIIIESSKEIHEVKEKLTKMLTDDLRNPDNNKEGLEKFLSTINEALKIAEDRNKLGRESSTDSEEAGDERKKISYKAILWAFSYMHSIKQMKKQVLEIVAASDRDTVKKDFYSLCADQMVELTPKGIDIALDYFQQQCQAKRESNTFFTAEEVKALIAAAGKKGDPEERLKDETQARIIAETQNIAKDQELAELRRQIQMAHEAGYIQSVTNPPTLKRLRSPSP